MKKAFFQLFIILLVTAHIAYADQKNSTNPGILLNPQDVPIFYDDNPLTGMKSFNIVTSFPLSSTGMQQGIEKTIEKAFETAGSVIHLKDNDMRGFGAGNLILIQVGNVLGWDGSEIDISRVSLAIETPVNLNKTDTKTFPIVWSINTFIQGSIATISEDNVKKAAQKLINEFIQNYRYVNQDQTKKPIFYIYD